MFSSISRLAPAALISAVLATSACAAGQGNSTSRSDAPENVELVDITSLQRATGGTLKLEKKHYRKFEFHANGTASVEAYNNWLGVMHTTVSKRNGRTCLDPTKDPRGGTWKGACLKMYKNANGTYNVNVKYGNNTGETFKVNNLRWK